MPRKPLGEFISAGFVEFAENVVEKQHGILSRFLVKEVELREFKAERGGALLTLRAELADIEITRKTAISSVCAPTCV